ncbi:thioester domain-containing protein [Actinocrispum sp. NPDC049592]|uniref:thioester domain-containing protein n=1 Tax=Actinocrispum sp. NPDC049592 TaxID=3154835 RepID=UPI00342F55F3
MRRVGKLRAGAALLGVTAIGLMASAIPAGADDAVTATAGQAAKGNVGYKVNVSDLNDKGSTPFDALLFDLKVGGKTLNAYCVDIDTNIDFTAEYVEKPWDQHSNKKSSFPKHAGEINWLLQHSYPNLDTDAVHKATGLKLHDGLSKQEAITATQAAAWYFSDDRKLIDVAGQVDPNNHDKIDEGTKADVRDVYNWLVDNAKKNADKVQPKPALTLTPDKLAGKPGSLIGPFTATTNADNVVIKGELPSGVKITDKDGKELDGKKQATKDKYEFYVSVPAGQADGSAKIKVSAEATLTSGRLFVGKKESQALILAGNGKANLTADATASWAVTVSTPTTEAPPAPQAKNELANTGASITLPLVIGGVLVLGGVGALIFVRRRRA